MAQATMTAIPMAAPAVAPRDLAGSYPPHRRPAPSPRLASHSSSHAKFFGAYQLLTTLGEGEFGKVKFAQHTLTKRYVAIKLVRKDRLDEVISEKLLREISILKQVDHPHIVRLLDVLENPKLVGIVMEHCGGGELFDHILSRDCLAEQDARRFFVQLIAGVCHLHARNIVHRDLKLENLLLSENNDIKIADMGFARTCLPNRRLPTDHRHPVSGTASPSRRLTPEPTHADDWILRTSCGSPFYAAPELVISDCYFAPKTDIWSCGVILYSMLAGFLPFDDDPNNPDGANIPQLYRHITSSPLNFPKSSAIWSAEVKHILSRILCLDPFQRAGWAEIWRHPWVVAYLDHHALPPSWQRDIDQAILKTEVLEQMRPRPEAVEVAKQRAATPTQPPVGTSKYTSGWSQSIAADQRTSPSTIAEESSMDGLRLSTDVLTPRGTPVQTPLYADHSPYRAGEASCIGSKGAAPFHSLPTPPALPPPTSLFSQPPPSTTLLPGNMYETPLSKPKTPFYADATLDAKEEATKTLPPTPGTSPPMSPNRARFSLAMWLRENAFHLPQTASTSTLGSIRSNKTSSSKVDDAKSPRGGFSASRSSARFSVSSGTPSFHGSDVSEDVPGSPNSAISPVLSSLSPPLPMCPARARNKSLPSVPTAMIDGPALSNDAVVASDGDTAHHLGMVGMSSHLPALPVVTAAPIHAVRPSKAPKNLLKRAVTSTWKRTLGRQSKPASVAPTMDDPCLDGSTSRQTSSLSLASAESDATKAPYTISTPSSASTLRRQPSSGDKTLTKLFRHLNIGKSAVTNET